MVKIDNHLSVVCSAQGGVAGKLTRRSNNRVSTVAYVRSWSYTVVERDKREEVEDEDVDLMVILDRDYRAEAPGHYEFTLMLGPVSYVTVVPTRVIASGITWRFYAKDVFANTSGGGGKTTLGHMRDDQNKEDGA